MAPRPTNRTYEIAERGGPGGRLVLACAGQGGACKIVISGYDGPQLPGRLTDAAIEARATGTSTRDRWRLHSREGSFDFGARAVDVIEERPALYEPMHRRFALSGMDRVAVRVLLWMLRLPGGARLLRRWHAHRSP